MNVARVGEGIRAILPADLQKVSTVGELPSLTAEGIALIMYDGNFSTEYFGSTPSTDNSIFQPVLKCVARNASYDRAAAWVEQLKEKLHRYNDEHFLSIIMAGAPMYLGRTPEKLCEFQVTFSLQVKE